MSDAAFTILSLLVVLALSVVIVAALWRGGKLLEDDDEPWLQMIERDLVTKAEERRGQ